MLKYSIYVFLIAFLQISCSNSESKEIQADLEIEENTNYHLLVFKNEEKAELWAIAEKSTFLDSFKIKNIPQLPIGEFETAFDNQISNLKIHFPNEFYQSKAYKIDQFQNLSLGIENLPTQFFNKFEKAKISKIIIFPNDNRLGGELAPCFACPHWIAEVYAFLNLKKKEYI